MLDTSLNETRLVRLEKISYSYANVYTRRLMTIFDRFAGVLHLC